MQRFDKYGLCWEVSPYAAGDKGETSETLLFFKKRKEVLVSVGER